MKKKNSMSKLYWLIPLIMVVLWFAVGAKAGIVRNGTSGQTGQDSLSVPLFALDTAGNRVEFDTTADWGYIVVRYPNGVKAVSDSFTIRGTNTPKIVKNAAEYGGFLQYCYRKQISDLDGTPINGTYSFEVTVRDSSLKLWTVVKNGEFQLYQTVTLSSLYDGQKYDNDSLVFGATLDNPSFLSPTTASRTLDVSATGEAGVDWGNVGSPTSTVGLTNTTVGTVTSATTASASNTAIGLATWNTDFGTAFTAGSMGDSLNGMQYSKVSQLIVANVDAAISTRGTSTLTASDNIGINWADVSNPTTALDLSATTIRSTDSALNVANIASTDTLTTILGNVNGTVATVTNLTNAPTNGDLTATMKTSVSAATWGAATSSYTGAGTFGNMLQRDSIRIKEIIDSLDTQVWASTSAGSGVDSAVVSRILRRMWGIQLGAAGSTDSVTYSQRLAAMIFIDSLMRTGLGDTVATFADSAVIARSVFDNDVVPLASRTVNTTQFGGTTVTGRDLGASVLISSGTGTGQLSVTSGVVSSNATQISGDATAADNLETMLDGTGGQTLTLEGLTIAASAGVGVAISGASGEYGMTVIGGTNGGGALFSSGATTGYGIVLTGSTAALSGQLTSSNFAAGAITANAIADLAIDSNTFALDARKMIAIRADSGAAGGTGLDSATTSRIMRRITWGLGGTGSNTDSTTLAERTATASGTVTADIYPFNGIKLTIDAAGADPDAQFVVDTASLGGLSSHQATLVNRQLVVRSLSGIEVQIPTTINRVAYTGANCSLSVNMNMPIDFAAGDTIQLAGWPWHDFATVSEASDSNALALLSADTTGLGGDATVGGAIVAEGSDTTKQKVMLTNMGLPRGLDSLANLSETATADGTLRRGEIVTARAAAETTMVILDRDSVLARGGIIDTVRYADTLGSQVASNCSSGGCPDSVGYAVTLVAYDSLTSAPVVSAQMAIRSSINGADLAVSPLTGVSGSFVFTIANAGTYYVITRAAGMTFPVRTLVVTGAQTDTVNGAGYSVSGHATVLGSVDCIGCDVRFVLESAGQSVTDTSTGYLITQTVVDTTTNGFGDFTMALPKTGNLLYTSGTIRKHPQWRVRISATDVEKEAKWDKLFDIPAESTQVHLSVVR